MRFDQQATQNQHNLHRFSENQNISFFIALLTFNYTRRDGDKRKSFQKKTILYK